MAKKPIVHMPVPVSEEQARALEARWDGRQKQAAGAPMASASPPSDGRIVARKGRILADGSRTEAPPRLRMTVYLPPDLGRSLDVAAVSMGREKSDIVAEAIAAWLERKH